MSRIPAAVVLCILATLSPLGCNTPGRFSTPAELAQTYATQTETLFRIEDDAGSAATLEPDRFFVPVDGESRKTFELVVDFYRHQARLLEVMQDRLPADVFAKFVAVAGPEPALFVPFLDEDAVQITSELTATASGRYYRTKSLEITLIQGPAGWRMLWNFEEPPAKAPGSGGWSFRQSLIESSIQAYQSATEALKTRTITDIDEVWRIMGIKPPATASDDDNGSDDTGS